jgi:HAD superfamily hydrolase (TIGR01450 family)
VSEDPLWFVSGEAAEFRPAAVTIDADGVLHRGHAVLPGALELIAALEERGIPWMIVTNNSRQTPAVAAAFYRKLGLPVEERNVSTAAQAMATYIATHHSGGGRPLVFSLGDADLTATLAGTGCDVTEDENAAEWLATAMDLTLNYDRLRRACDAVRRGAHFLTANLDPVIPSETGVIPGVGAIAALIQVATGVEPVNMGKPGPELMLQAVDAMGAKPDRAVHLGDRLDSDVLGARRAGMRAVLVETGGHTRADVPNVPPSEQPEAVAVDLPTVMRWWGMV